ncbi:DUF4255 domain-containing protein [Leptolyngbya ohadii]|uniref:DUF4255 domain-containing protein n=1 Tax=Leptolyngbya ohadii TaxID=1962290 RepID=UPI000B59AFF6|nr:DUF4255 domain-containing protein [Leptolyngbya ohadii]
MANVSAIYSVGESIATYLSRSYPEPLRTQYPCEFSLLSSGELIDTSDYGGTDLSKLSLFLYRVTMNEHLRNTRKSSGVLDSNVPLALDLHYLLTVWASSAAAEHTILAWTMRQIFLNPILDMAFLSAEGGWNAGNVVQLFPAELSNEDVMRIWDALEPPYHLSVSYVARVVRIDADRQDAAEPVIATRFSYRDGTGAL